MPLEYLWAGSPCRRPVRRPFRHAGMPLRYLWTGEPCRRTARRPPSPREDATEVPVGRGAMPKGALAELIELRCVRFGTPNCWILRFVLLSLIDWRSAFGLTGCYAVLLDRESSGPGCLTSPTSRSNPANPSCQARNNLSTGHAPPQPGTHRLSRIHNYPDRARPKPAGQPHNPANRAHNHAGRAHSPANRAYNQTRQP